MSRQLRCEGCKHYVRVQMFNGDPELYYCSNEDTKIGPHPIGFIQKNAPACKLFSPKELVVLPSAHSQDRKLPLEHQIVKVAVLASTVLGLCSWLLSEIRPEWIAFVTHLVSAPR